MAVYELFAGNLLSMQQATGGPNKIAESFFNIFSSAAYQHLVQPLLPDVRQTFVIGQSVTLNRRINVSASNRLGLYDNAGRTIRLDVYDTFFPYQSVWQGRFGQGFNPFQIFQEAIGVAAKPTANAFTIVQEVTVLASRGLILTDELDFQQSASAVKINPSFIGTEQPTLVQSPTVTFVCETRTLTLKAPVFGNSEALEVSRIARRSRGGDLIIYRDPIWPKTDVLKMEFHWLKEADKASLLQFLAFSLGKDILYTDYEGRQWIGVITNPQTPIAEEGRNLGWTFQMEFQVIVSFSEAQYITALYNVELARDPAASEISRWRNRLAQFGRGYVSKGVVNSPEARTLRIKGWYLLYLGRAASDHEATDIWLPRYTSNEVVQSGIAGSTEAYNYAQTYPGLTGTADQKYIKLLFTLMLGRLPSGPELSNYETYLTNNGKVWVANHILESLEFRQNTVTGYYENLLLRTPSGTEVSNWATSGNKIDEIRIGFLGSLEYYNLVSV